MSDFKQNNSNPISMDELGNTFMPHLMERIGKIKAGKRLVHYTSAENAYRIITGRQIWLRNSQMMNDYSEIKYGLDCVASAWSSSSGKKLQATLDEIHKGISEQIETKFNTLIQSLQFQTYLLSLSEHDDREDEYGRLSMWRAYGGNTGVAMVLNNSAFLSNTDLLKVYSSPVFYKGKEEFADWFSHWAERLISRKDLLQRLDIDTLVNVFIWAFRNFTLCTKHPAFSEELEWRVFHSPHFEGASDWIEISTEIIKNTPQFIVKFHLRDDEGRGIFGVSPKQLLNRIIIGPCEYPAQVREGIADALRQAEIPDPLEKIWMSLIPYRHA